MSCISQNGGGILDRRRYIQHRRTVDVLPASWKQLVNSSTLGEVKMTWKMDYLLQKINHGDIKKIVMLVCLILMVDQ